MLEFEEDCFSYLSREEIEALEPDSRKSFLCDSSAIKVGVYKISNNLNNKIYIGSSKNIKSRFHSHIYSLSKGKHNSKHLQNFYNKHKEIHFRMEVLEECDIKDLKDREQFYLDTLKPFKDNGFNICKKATSLSFNEESIIKNSKSRTIGFVQYSLNGKLIKIHESRMELAKEFGVEKTNFNKACNTLQTYLGYIWKYNNGNMPEQLSLKELTGITSRFRKNIRGYTDQGELIANYRSALEFYQKTGWDRKNIKRICSRENSFFRGLYWYAE